jgi:hypothetical protein
LKTSPDKYTSLDDLLVYNKPDNMDLYVKTYGDQGITGFLELTGAKKNAGTSDEIQYWEEGRLHNSFTATVTAETVAWDSNAMTFAEGAGPRVGDVLYAQNTGERLYVDSGTEGGTQMNVRALGGGGTFSVTNGRFSVIGNIAGQGANQPDDFYQTEITKRQQTFVIARETFHVNGSQASNIGWINTGNGDYRWYVKGEMDTRKRFLDQREMLMLFGEQTGTAVTLGQNDGIVGTEGYFSALEDRGIVSADMAGATATFGNFDTIIYELDYQGAPSEYAMYVNREVSLSIDDMLGGGPSATGAITSGLASQFGAFNNSPEMAVNLGFKSFTRGGYTFHKHDWKLLNDPTLVGYGEDGFFKGAMVPMTQVADARTGERAPSLQMYFKDAGGYSRELNHWVEGGDVLGFRTNNQDVAKFHYRSECCLVTRAANQHVLLK